MAVAMRACHPEVRFLPHQPLRGSIPDALNDDGMIHIRYSQARSLRQGLANRIRQMHLIQTLRDHHPTAAAVGKESLVDIDATLEMGVTIRITTGRRTASE